MAIGRVFLCMVSGVTAVFAAPQPGFIESLLLAASQRPWLWGVYVFTVGLPIILFVSFMWPDKRFGPPDQPYYYMRHEDDLRDDPESPQRTLNVKGQAVRVSRRGTRRKSD